MVAVPAGMMWARLQFVLVRLSVTVLLPLLEITLVGVRGLAFTLEIIGVVRLRI